MPIAGSCSSEPGNSTAATTGKAADEGSAITVRSLAFSSRSPATRISRPPPSAASSVTVAPKWRSRRSLWSRVACISMTPLLPGAARPASRTALFTWAEATGIS